MCDKQKRTNLTIKKDRRLVILGFPKGALQSTGSERKLKPIKPGGLDRHCLSDALFC